MPKAKRKKRPRQPLSGSPKWRIPPARPGQDRIEPDVGDLMADLIIRYAKKRMLPAAGPGANPSDIAKQAYGKQDRCLREYMDMLQELPQYPSAEDLLSADRIDLRGISPSMRDDEAAADAMEEYVRAVPSPIWCVVPCFRKGVILPMLSTSEGLDLWIWFEVIEADEAASTAVIEIQSYQADGAREGKFDVMYGGRISMKACMEGGFLATDATAEPKDIRDERTLFSTIPPKDTGWDEETCVFWEMTALQYAADMDARMAAKHATALDQTADIFIKSVLMSNYMLSSFRPAVERQPKARKTAADPEEGRPGKPEPIPPDKRVRTVGTVRFVSSRPPRPSHESPVRKYVTESWSVRGHVRRYRSGKTVYVKPAVKHRKALAGKPGTDRVQTILRVVQTDPDPDGQKEG